MSNSEQHVERIANGSDDFQVTIRNCNSIAEATISIRRGGTEHQVRSERCREKYDSPGLRLRAEGDSAWTPFCHSSIETQAKAFLRPCPERRRYAKS